VDNVSSFQNFCKKRSIFEIKNTNDNLCLPRALTVAIAFAERDLDGGVNNVIRRNTRLQAIRAEELCKAADSYV
jgi:hypothetical protein